MNFGGHSNFKNSPFTVLCFRILSRREDEDDEDGFFHELIIGKIKSCYNVILEKIGGRTLLIMFLEILNDCK